MSRLRIAVLTAAIAVPLGAFVRDAMRKGHPDLENARASLNDADRFITASQKANERVWGDEGGHGAKAKEAVQTARHELDLAAAWVHSRP